VKTWKIEMAVVAAILLIVNIFTSRLFTIEIISAVAVLLTFCHAQISSRLTEQQSLIDKPTVDCYRKLFYYHIGKEICWLLYFLLNHSYSALVGVFVFLLYPLWRKYYKHES
jgi:hypothetical protein